MTQGPSKTPRLKPLLDAAAIPVPVLIELPVFKDERGFFLERFSERTFSGSDFERLGVGRHYVQDNHSSSEPGVIRGLHFQRNPEQGKLIQVLTGAIFDVAVDIRKESPYFGRAFSAELSPINENGMAPLLWIPKGFAHGFAVLGHEKADVFYKVDALYDAASDGGIRWNDPDLKIVWPIGVGDPIISDKDQRLPRLRDVAPLASAR